MNHSDEERTSDVDVSNGGDSATSSPGVELLVLGREKRSTAGNRLRHLLDVEEALVEEVEVDGIFAETDEDEEFRSSEDEDEEGEEEDEDGDVEDREGQEQDDNASGQAYNAASSDYDTRTIKKNGLRVSQDDVLSSSDDSESEGHADDSDGGEREFRRQEQAERARARRTKERKSMLVTTVNEDGESEGRRKRQKVAATTTRVAVGEVTRASSRAHTMRNKAEILDRLEQERQRRASMPTPKVKSKVTITQAERIERAKLIEQRNIASLNKFFEQEVERKRTQRAAMLAKEIVFGPFVRWVSASREMPASAVARGRIVEELPPNAVRRPFKEPGDEGTADRPKRKYKRRVKEVKPEDAKVVEGVANADKGEKKDDGKSATQDQNMVVTVPATGDVQVKPESITALTPTSTPSAENAERVVDADAMDVDVPESKLVPDTELKSEAAEPTADTTSALPPPEISREPSTAPSTQQPPVEREMGPAVAVSDDPAVSATPEPSTVTGPTASTSTLPQTPRERVIRCSLETLSFEDLEDTQYHLDASLIRTLLFGAQAASSRVAAAAPRQICPVSGKTAQFVEPDLGIEYYNQECLRIIREVEAAVAVRWSRVGETGYFYMGGEFAEVLAQAQAQAEAHIQPQALEQEQPAPAAGPEEFSGPQEV
ncbi:YL1 nuclear protein-domain-containing protein [Limtongia smithiae]|uniref:YL1 nuclear protein-domain-containing protein n=1 Tax=Limtongia smithiae TaxID=1125753 RepID=UPI0034CE204E